MANVSIEIKGLEHLLKVTTPELYKQEVQTIVSKGAISGENFAKIAAPVDTGRLRGAITHKIGEMQAEYGVIGGASTGGAVGMYGLKLEESIGRAYRYRRGPRQGDLLKGWFSNTYAQTQTKVNELVAESIRRIEAKWAGRG